MAFDTTTDVSVDTLIAKRLPVWLKSASAARIAALHRALSEQQTAQDAVARLFAGLRPLEEFASARLTEALDALVESSIDVRGSVMRREVLVRSPSAVGWVPDGISRHIVSQSLLECALHNFAAGEASGDGWPDRATLLDAQGNALDLQPHVFAAACRTLDVGGSYQQHLQAVLLADEARRRATESILEQAWRTSLGAALELARTRSGFEEAAAAQLQPLTLSPPQACDLAAMDMRLLGHRIRGALLLQRPRANGQPSSAGVIAWIPGDPEGALSLHASASALFHTLGRRLRDAGYRRFFQRFVSQRDRLAFARTFERLDRAAATADSVGLDGRLEAIGGPVMEHLRQVQIETLLDDAQVLAVPTRSVDSAERDRRLRWLKDLGLDLLGLASFYVPQLGLPVLAIAATQMTEEVFEGYHAWTLGDREAALGHLAGVAINLAQLGIDGATGAAFQTLERSTRVDGLVPVRGDDAQLRLIDPRLPGYAVQPHTLAEGQRGVIEGVWHAGVNGQTYQVHGGVEALAVVHPQRPEAPVIGLEHNGDGGVRHALEGAARWQGAGQMLRRLGTALASVSDQAAVALLRTVGMDEGHLRRLHLENAPIPARLYDAAQRYRLHQWYPRLRDELFEAQVQVAQAMPAPAAGPLQRDFPALTARACSEIVALANSAQLTTLRERTRVPLALAEQARWMLRDARLDRACAGFEQRAAVIADTEQLALGLIDGWSSWPQDVRIEVRESTAPGRVRAQIGSQTAADNRALLLTRSGYLAVDGQGVAVAGAQADDDLFQGLLWLMDEVQRQSLGQPGESAAGLADALADRAFADRDRAARLIGMTPPRLDVRPPQRLGDGRIGYPLSGRGEGSRHALFNGYQQVFPTLSDVEIEVYLETVRLRGEAPWDHLRALHDQYARLNEGLVAWRERATSTFEREQRRQIATRLRRCWRRKRAQPDGQYQLVIDREPMPDLPSFAAEVRFDHVSLLTLRGAGLQDVPAEFLAHFANLRSLDLRDNRLQRIPDGLQGLTRLTHLQLSGNRIVIDDAGLNRLSGLNGLVELDLSGNPVGQLPPVANMPQLQRLLLRNTGLTEVPLELYTHWSLEDIDLRSNRVETLDPALVQSRRALARLSLHDNPLPGPVRQQARANLDQAQAAASLPLRRHGAGGQASMELWLTGMGRDERQTLIGHWMALSLEPDSAAFMQFLYDLGASDDYQYQGIDLRRRVWEIIEACVQNSELRELVFQQAAGPRSCSDRLLLTLSLIEVRVLAAVRTAGLDPNAADAALLRLGRDLYRLDEVDRIAGEHIAALGPNATFDDVEIYLVYRAGLVTALSLPAQSRYMYYRTFANVTQNQLTAAASRVLREESDARVAASLSQREFWQTYLRQRDPQAFEALNAPYHQRLERLMENTQDTSQALLEAIDTLASERDGAERALILARTLDMVERFSRGELVLPAVQ